jgi:hypothetical protein
MRKVIIPQGATPPADWLQEAEQLTAELRAALNEDERKTIIDKHQKLWRDNRVRDWLLGLYHNKCWYTEAQEVVSAIHVDHYRPKGRVTELDKSEHDGYWWLAFDWTNYRMCGQLINVKKSDYFPLGEPQRATPDNPASLKLEATVLIDPITDDARLISYEMDEDACIAVPAEGVDDSEEKRATAIIDILGLNRLDRLNQKRADVWRKCRDSIADYSSAANEPQCLKTLRQALAVKALKEMVGYEQEFSSVAEACLRKTAPEPIRAKVSG